MTYRVTPSLGPDLEQVGPFYTDALGPGDGPTYALGARVAGSDGHDYVMVQAAGALTADDEVTIDFDTFVASFVSSGGDATVPSDVQDSILEDSFFHARLNNA